MLNLNNFFFNYESLTDVRGQINLFVSLIENNKTQNTPDRGREHTLGAENMLVDKPESLKFLIPRLISLPLYFFPVHIFWSPTFGKKLIKRTPWAWHDWTQFPYIEIVLHKVGYARYLFFLLFQITRGGWRFVDCVPALHLGTPSPPPVTVQNIQPR